MNITTNVLDDIALEGLDNFIREQFPEKPVAFEQQPIEEGIEKPEAHGQGDGKPDQLICAPVQQLPYRASHVYRTPPARWVVQRGYGSALFRTGIVFTVSLRDPG